MNQEQFNLEIYMKMRLNTQNRLRQYKQGKLEVLQYNYNNIKGDTEYKSIIKKEIKELQHELM